MEKLLLTCTTSPLAGHLLSSRFFIKSIQNMNLKHQRSLLTRLTSLQPEYRLLLEPNSALKHQIVKLLRSQNSVRGLDNQLKALAASAIESKQMLSLLNLKSEDSLKKEYVRWFQQRRRRQSENNLDEKSDKVSSASDEGGKESDSNESNEDKKKQDQEKKLLTLMYTLISATFFFTLFRIYFSEQSESEDQPLTMATPPPASGAPAQSEAQQKIQAQLEHMKDHKMSPEELAILNKINDEAFWKRAMPCSIASMVGATLGLQRGMLKPSKFHPKYGRFITIGFAGLGGLVLGKISYIPTVKKHILERMPDSDYARLIRGEDPREKRVNQLPLADLPPKAKLYDEQPQTRGLDDTFRPSMDRNATDEKLDPSAAQKGTTYDELRRRNREQAEGQTPRQPSGDLAPPWREDTPNAGASAPPARKKRTNMWGDEIED